MLSPIRALIVASLMALTLAGCRSDAPEQEQPVVIQNEATPVAPAPADRERAAALDAALDSLEAFVMVLGEIRDPFDAWNRAPEVARMMRWLDAAQPVLTLDMPEEEARRRFGPQIARFEEIQARRLEELERIGQDRIVAQVLFEEIAKADTAATD